MVNRYDTPAQAQFMNTYVPIPFEQMYNLGQTAKQDVDKALNTLSTTFDKWSDFRSPSQVDTQAWYDETIGRVAPTVEKLSSNLDYLKSAAGRAELYTALNNLDYSRLGQLQQSRDAMLQGQEFRQRLAAAGKYNPLWHDVDFTNYNTLGGAGIFDDISPLAYSSVQELADPYVSSLKDSFINSDGMYDYYGVTSDQISNIIDQNLSGIMITPEAQKHIEVYRRQNPGATQQEAETWFRNKAVQDTQQYARINRAENRFALEDYKERIRLATKKGAKEDIPVSPALLTDQLSVVGQETLSNNILNTDFFPNTRNAIANYGFGSKAMSEAMAHDAQLQFEATTGAKPNELNNFQQLQSGVNTVLNSFASPINNAASDVILSTASVGTRDLGNGSEYVLPNSRGLEFPAKFALDLMGTSAKGNAYKGKTGEQFELDLSSGKFNRLSVQPTGEQYTYVEDGQVKQAMRLKASIPTEELKQKGYNDKVWRYFPFINHINEDFTELSKKLKDNGGYITNDKDGNEIFVFDVVKRIPSDGATKSFINQEYLNRQTSNTYGNEAYESTQAKSFDLPY